MNPFIRQIVGRCHVSDTNREVIRYVISRMSGGLRTFRALPRTQRRTMLQQVIRQHRENRELFHYVMGGLR